MEMQLYHYDSQFDSPNEAANYPDGIAVSAHNTLIEVIFAAQMLNAHILCVPLQVVAVLMSTGYTNIEIGKIQALLPVIYNGTTTGQLAATPTFDCT